MFNRWLTVLSVLSAVPLVGLATPLASLWSDVRVMHTWNSVPENWESLGPPPAHTTVDLYIALKPDRKNALIDALYEVSDPGHQKYSAYLSKKQVAELVAPHNDTRELVHSWLAHHGVPSSSISTSHAGGWLMITGVPTSQADGLLGASYQLYRHTGTNSTGPVLRTVSYAIPAALHAHVQMVAPTTFFPSPRKSSIKEAAVMMNATGEIVNVLSKRAGLVSPSLLRRLYKTETYVPTAMDKNGLGVLGLNNEYPRKEDFTKFMNTYRQDAVAADFTVEQINNGGNDPNNPGMEANLDTQYAAAMSFPTQQIFHSTGGHMKMSPTNGKPIPGDGLLEWLNFLLKEETNTPPTVSISYGFLESSVPPRYKDVLCDLFAKLGAIGVSVLAGSGDKGVGPEDCIDSSGNIAFQPMFPATCPHVTGVGGTMSEGPEVAWPGSGGGFSRHFTRPDYQKDAVNTYLGHLKNDHAGRYNPAGRGVPDIAAQAARCRFVFKDSPLATSGTSCSTPTVAGIIALLNDFMISKGKKPLGFLNPWLYGGARKGFVDITSGSNPGCTTTGFTATEGWDPVTGLGTPDFEELLPRLCQHPNFCAASSSIASSGTASSSTTSSGTTSSSSTSSSIIPRCCTI